MTNIKNIVRTLTNGMTSNGFPVGGNITGLNIPKITNNAITAGRINNIIPTIRIILPFFISSLKIFSPIIKFINFSN